MFVDQNDLYIENGTPRMACLQAHIQKANIRLPEPYPPTDIPALTDIAKDILNEFQTDNKACSRSPWALMFNKQHLNIVI